MKLSKVPEIQKLSAAEQTAIVQTLNSMNTAKAQLIAQLNLIMAQNDLKGSWSLNDAGTELLKAPEPEGPVAVEETP